MTEREVASRMLKKGYKYILLVKGKDALYAKTAAQVGPLLRDDLKHEKVDVMKTVDFLKLPHPGRSSMAGALNGIFGQERPTVKMEVKPINHGATPCGTVVKDGARNIIKHIEMMRATIGEPRTSIERKRISRAWEYAHSCLIFATKGEWSSAVGSLLEAYRYFTR